LATTSVQVDSDLLQRLRERHPGKDDRTLLEELARVKSALSAVEARRLRHEHFALGDGPGT
jgi:hypothetical protein